MNPTSNGRLDLREEMRLIPKPMYAVAVIAFLAMQLVMLLVVFRHHPHAPPVAVQVLISTLAATVSGIIMLLLGYINRDAKRRGMNYVLWTFLVLLIPNAIGYIIYFVVRQPIQSPCPQCGAKVNPTFNFCPKCKFNLHPACPVCHHSIDTGAAFCPYCAADLKEAGGRS